MLATSTCEEATVQGRSLWDMYEAVARRHDVVALRVARNILPLE